MFLAHLKGTTQQVNGEDVTGPSKFFIEDNAEHIALNLARIDDGEILNLEYYEIAEVGNAVVLHPVNLAAGPRSSAPTEEVVEIEANGQSVGSVNRVAP